MDALLASPPAAVDFMEYLRRPARDVTQRLCACPRRSPLDLGRLRAVPRPRGVHAEARAPQRHPGPRALRRLRTHALADRRRRVLSRDCIAANIGRTAQGVAEDAEWSAVADAAVPGAERRVDIRVRSSRRGDG